MNTLLGELATLNDVQYPRYRVAFKFRKLQKSLYLEYGDVGMLSEVMHLTGLQRLRDDDIVPLSQLSTVLSELYSAIRTARPVLKQAQLQEAQDSAYNWLQLAYRTGSGEEIVATHLKITLCLFLGSKVTDKARFIFGLLANINGAIERDGVRLLVRILQQLAHTLQENLYHEYQSLDKVFQECLVFVRDSEDVEEEQLDGGIRRQWLSQFEFTKLFTASPPPPFFSWLNLWYTLPTLEKVIHTVRCAVCARKPIVSLRYQCMQCHNFHMCQMCFLKGRTSDRHQPSHQVLEFSDRGRSSSRSWHHRLLGLPHRGTAMGGKMVTDKREPFSFRPESRASHNSSNEETDIAMTAITDMIANSQMSPVFKERRESHKPAMIRIGSDGKPAFGPKKEPPEAPAAHTLQTSPARRVSYTSGSSSPESLSSGGSRKFSFEGGGVPRSVSGGIMGGQERSATLPHAPRKMKATASDGNVTRPNKKKDLTDVNRRLSMEVDQILMDLPAPPSHLSTASHPRNHLGKTLVLSPRYRDNRSLDNDLEGIQKEEQQLQVQVSKLTDKREKLSHELQDLISQVQQMQVGFQTLGRGNHSSSWARLAVAPNYHARSDSAPVQPPSPPSSSSPESSLPPLVETEISPEPASVVLRERNADGYRASVYSPPLGGSQYQDPLTEYHVSGDVSGTTPDHRFSVAW